MSELDDFTNVSERPRTRTVASLTQRERERRSRERRAARLLSLRENVEALERALLVLPTLQDDANALWEEAILDPDAARVRKYLRRSVSLAYEARKLETSQKLLGRLLHEHRLACYAIAGLHATISTDDWDGTVRRWQAITHRYYTPLTIDECEGELDACWKELNTFLWSMDMRAIGASYFGWQAQRRIVEALDAVQFSFEKVVRGYPMQNFIDTVWSAYTDQDIFNALMNAGRARGWVEVLQKFTPDDWIVRCTNRYPAISVDVHKINLVSRVRTRTSSTQFVRSLCIPEVQKKTCEPTDVWNTNFVWLRFQALNDDSTDYRAHIGGKITGHDAVYVAHWLVETLAVLLRFEWAATRRGLLSKD